MLSYSTVHPHMCGEQRFNTHNTWVESGSSPHVWGTAPATRRDSSIPRFIPTCVGNRTAPCAVCGLASVHPHMCGEQLSAPGWTCGLGGSSPHVWGTVPSALMAVAESRFIPTCVGNSLKYTTTNWCRPVHPHMCGEQWLVAALIAVFGGSSPHVWGTGRARPRLFCCPRFIPTCVGNR